MKRALITGITGQDGSYLAEFLLGRGDYEVHGLVRRSSAPNLGRLEDVEHARPGSLGRIRLHPGDLADAPSLARVIAEVEPDEVYNLGAMSHVRVSFDMPSYTADVTGLGPLRLLEALRACGQIGRVRVYQASSAEMFGLASPPQTIDTLFHPRSPYGCAKLLAHGFAVNYREAFGLFACSGILFNHESPRRGEGFVSRKITRAAGRIKEGLQDGLALGNLVARRDWGFAGDYVRAMWLMLQRDEPGDYVIATGACHSVREFLDAAFARLGLDARHHVRFDPGLVRPSEVPELRGDAAPARERLGWRPEFDFDALVGMMVEHDHRLARRERLAREEAGRRAGGV